MYGSQLPVGHIDINTALNKPLLNPLPANHPPLDSFLTRGPKVTYTLPWWHPKYVHCVRVWFVCASKLTDVARLAV